MTPVETEHVSLAHLQLAQSMRGEVKKLEEFREKQKELKKKVGALAVTWPLQKCALYLGNQI